MAGGIERPEPVVPLVFSVTLEIGGTVGCVRVFEARAKRLEDWS